MKPDLLNINGILGVDLKDIKGKYYIIKKAEETYESNINFLKKKFFNMDLHMKIFSLAIYLMEKKKFIIIWKISIIWELVEVNII